MFSQYSRGKDEKAHFSETIPLGGKKPEQKQRVHHLLIDNRDRSADSKSEFEFIVRFAEIGLPEYQNVTSVDLRGCAIPKIDGEMYCLLHCNEFSPGDATIDGSNDAINAAYAVIYYDSSQQAAGDVKSVKGADFYSKSVQFSPPLRRLDRLHLKFTKHSGQVITTAETAGSNVVSVLFEVTSLLPATSS